MRKTKFGMVVAGTCAGLVAGLFGAGGGLVLVPLLTLLTDTEDASVFSSSISIILPICPICLAASSAGFAPVSGGRKSPCAGCTGDWGC